MKIRAPHATAGEHQPAASTHGTAVGRVADLRSEARTQPRDQQDFSDSPRMLAQLRAIESVFGPHTPSHVAQRHRASARPAVFQLAKRVRNVVTHQEREVEDDYVLGDNELFVGEFGPIPRGFDDEPQFRQLTRPYAQQDRSGRLIFSGSSVTNRSYKSGQPFRPESDIDVGLVVPDRNRLDQVGQNGFPVRGTPLSQVEQQTTQQARETIGRPMGLRIYDRPPNRTYIERPHTPEHDRDYDEEGNERPSLPRRYHPYRREQQVGYSPQPRRRNPPYPRRVRSRARDRDRDRFRDREDDRDRDRDRGDRFRYGRDRYGGDRNRARSPDREERRRSRSRERYRDRSRDRPRDRRRERSRTPYRPEGDRERKRERRRSPSRSRSRSPR
jgi:hypothetical protein